MVVPWKCVEGSYLLPVADPRGAFAVEGVSGLVKGLFLLPARLLGGR
ncbi:MAG TPA: hypothetical protein VGJ89_11115 [Geothrix sp.]|jgi:hypothetical protein